MIPNAIPQPLDLRLGVSLAEFAPFGEITDVRVEVMALG